jgi:hypothetical protein
MKNNGIIFQKIPGLPVVCIIYISVPQFFKYIIL